MFSKVKLSLTIFFLCIALIPASTVKATAEIPPEEATETNQSEVQNPTDGTTDNSTEDTTQEEQPQEPQEPQEPETPQEPEQPQIKPPKLSKTSIKITYGKTASFPKIKNLPSEYEIKYSSSNSSIASIDKKGLIKGIEIGTCKITASIRPISSDTEDETEYKLVLKVSVQSAIKTISFSYLENSTIKLGMGQKRTLLYTTSPKSASVPPLEFRSSNPSIASVSKTGTISAKKAGKTKITVKIKGMKKIYDSVTVKVTKRSEPFSYSMKNLSIVSTSSSLYTYQAMVQDLKQLENKYGDRMSFSKVSSTYDNRNLYEVKLGNPDAKKHIFISASMHAREYMASLLTMKQLEYYCYYYYTGKYKGTYYSELFDKVCVHLIPMVNPDGISISQFGSKGIHNATLRRNVINICKKYGGGSANYYRTWKANARGVDLNRNFDVAWKQSANDVKHPANASYKGISAASEKETKALVQAINNANPKATINYHAMGSILYWYFGQKGTLLKDSKRLLNEVRSLTHYTPVGGTYHSYDAAGLGDWVSIKKKLPTVTIEIGRSPCPLKIREFPSIWSKNREIWAAVSSLYD